MPNGFGTKMAVVPSPMPVVLAQPRKDPNNNDEPTVRVNPGTIRLGSKQYRLKQVIWINQTGADVTFTFDTNGCDQFFNPPPVGSITKHDGEQLALDVSASAPEGRLCTYTVDCQATGSPAWGNSPPELSCP
jgi:hypothetical protein